jgi:hypothetical protein
MNEHQDTNPEVTIELEQAKARILTLEEHNKKRDSDFEKYKRDIETRLEQLQTQITSNS